MTMTGSSMRRLTSSSCSSSPLMSGMRISAIRQPCASAALGQKHLAGGKNANPQSGGFQQKADGIANVRIIVNNKTVCSVMRDAKARRNTRRGRVKVRMLPFCRGSLAPFIPRSREGAKYSVSGRSPVHLPWRPEPRSAVEPVGARPGRHGLDAADILALLTEETRQGGIDVQDIGLSDAASGAGKRAFPWLQHYAPTGRRPVAAHGPSRGGDRHSNSRPSSGGGLLQPERNTTSNWVAHDDSFASHVQITIQAIYFP